MGQRRITAALGDRTPRALYRNEGDILSYQNADGGFSRLWGGRGDLLLSVLVAENGAVSYGEEALAQFIRGRIKEPGDREALLLAYWGLSVFSDEMLSEMQSYCVADDLSAREKLVLAQGLLNLGDVERARVLYLEVRREFTPVGGEAPSLPGDQDQQRLSNAALLADLGLSLGEEDLAPFIAELARAENTTMTGRYLVSLCILRTLDAAAVARYGGEEDRKGKSLVSLVPAEPQGEGTVEIAYYKGDEKIEEAKVGDRVRVSFIGAPIIARMTFTWFIWRRKKRSAFCRKPTSAGKKVRFCCCGAPISPAFILKLWPPAAIWPVISRCIT